MEAPTLSNFTGITFTENTAPGIIYSRLGISLPVPPQRIDLTSSNKARLLWNNPTDISIPLMYAQKTAGEYWGDENTYVINPDQEDPQDIFKTDIHENFHSYIQQINPIFSTIGDFQEAVYKKTLESAPSLSAIQSLYVLTAFEEGITTWCETEVVGMESNESASADTTDYLRGLHVNLIGELNGLDPHKPDTFMSISRNAIELINEVSSEALQYYNSRMRYFYPHFLPLQYYNAFNNAQYAIGHHYVFHAMNSLRTNGLSVADSLNKLIINPPTTTEEFADPLAYAKSL